MKLSKKTVRFIALIVTASVLFLPSVLQAKEIDLKEAADWGIQHNYDLQEIRYNIEILERDLEILDAGKALQINLDVTPIWGFGGEESSISNEYGAQSSTNNETSLISLKAEKTISDDLNISAEISWKENDFEEMSFEGIVEDINANIQVEKQIYPAPCSQSEQQTFQAKNNLQKKIEELTWEEAEKQIDFIEGYLTIARLTEEVNLAKEKYQQVKEELERVHQQVNLGEGGYQQETEAKLALMEAENQLFDLEQSLTQQKQEWYLQLSLPEDFQILFEEEPAYLDALRLSMEQLNLENEKEESLFNQAIENHYQIKIGYLEKDSLLKEAEWTENEGKPKIEVFGGYDFSDQSWYAMLDLSWNLTDGGTQELKEENCEATILQKEKEIDHLIKTLQLEMNKLLDQDQYNQLNLQAKLTALKEEEYTKEMVEKQYQEKIVSSSQWQNQLIALTEIELEVKKAQDQLLINRLRLVNFLGI